MISLSQILENPQLVENGEISNVLVDVESFTPPEGLKFIGLSYIDKGGDIDEILMDVIISYGLSGVEVVLEIPPQTAGIDARYMMSVAANAGFSVALLPPPAGSDAALKAVFEEKLDHFAEAYFQQANFAKAVVPVGNFLEYLFVELMKPGAPFVPRDPYILEQYVNVMDSSYVDEMKAFLRQKFYDITGGKEEFEQFSWGLIRGIHAMAEENCQDLLQNQTENVAN